MMIYQPSAELTTSLDEVVARDGDGLGASQRRLDTLNEDECRSYLEQATIGRVGASLRGSVEVLPVVYTLHDGKIAFRAVSRTRLRAIVREPVVTFEVDSADPVTKTGWSVVVRGAARLVSQPDELERLASAGLDPWVDGEDDLWLVIEPWKITGRRLR